MVYSFVSDESREIFASIKQELLSDKIKLPGLPDIARRVQVGVNNPDFSAADIAKIVQTDIPLSGRVIQVANSPLYKGVTPVENCQSAITRLGMKVVKNLVTSFSVRRLYSGKSANARKKVEQLWKHSVKIGAISFTLARVTPGFDPERAMLAGLVHGIGELLILNFAERHTDFLQNEKLYKDVVARYQHKLGAVILKHWRFDQSLIQVALSSEDWLRNPSSKPDYADVVLVSHLEELLITNKVPRSVANPRKLPVYAKFPVFKLGKSAHKELLMEAQDEIGELQRLLS